MHDIHGRETGSVRRGRVNASSSSVTLLLPVDGRAVERFDTRVIAQVGAAPSRCFSRREPGDVAGPDLLGRGWRADQ